MIFSLFTVHFIDIHPVSNMMEKLIGKNEKISDNPLITNFSEHNLLHSQIINKKQVSSIKVDVKTRKIHITYQNNKNIWKSFNLPTEHSFYNITSKLYLPIDDFKIEGLSNEVGVKTVGGIYLNSDSSLCEYLKKVLSSFENEKTTESNRLLKLFLEYVFNSNFLEYSYKEKDFDYLLRRVSQRRNSIYHDEELLSKMWEKIDVSEFKKVVLVDNHVLFSLDNWARSNSFYY